MKIRRQNILQIARTMTDCGLSVIPIGEDKRPANRLLPTNEEGNPTWLPYRQRLPDDTELQTWFGPAGTHSMAVITGTASVGLLVLDFDVPEFYPRWRDKVGELAAGLPVQQTGGGGYQVFVRCPEPGPNRKLAHAPNPAANQGREIAIETRGEGGYAVVPPSHHPSGGRYRMLTGSLTDVPSRSQADVDAMIQAAIELDDAPIDRDGQHREQRALTHERRRQGIEGSGRSVIDDFNDKVSIHTVLQNHSYGRRGNRYVRPGGSSASVTIRDGRSFHHSSNDDLNDRYWHSPFDAYCKLEHGGDCKAAVKGAAQHLRPAPYRMIPGKGATGAASGPAVTSPSPTIAEYQPFPTELLPLPIARFISETGAAMNCEDAQIALPLLAALAAAIGMTRRIELKSTWREPSILWTVIVAPSGSRKTPPFKFALEPVFQKQAAATSEYSQSMRAFEQACKECKEEDEQPVRPTLRHFYVTDTTVEALAPILQENPRGVLLARDELSGWVGGFNQYKGGKGADASQYLEFHGGGQLKVDRKGSPSIHVRRAAVSITGTIQPPVLARSLGDEHFQNGMAARMLFASPPPKVHQWTDAVVSPKTVDQVNGVFNSLWALGFGSEGQPIDLRLTKAGKAVWVRFYNDFNKTQHSTADDRTRAALSKLEGYAARFSLVIHLVRVASGDPTVESFLMIDEKSVEVGIALVEWFAKEMERVYALLAEPAEARQLRLTADVVRSNGGRMTVRELQRSSGFGQSDDAKAALQELVDAGLGVWEHPQPNSKGGRPTEVFVLMQEPAETAPDPEAEAQDSVVSEPEQLPRKLLLPSKAKLMIRRSIGSGQPTTGDPAIGTPPTCRMKLRRPSVHASTPRA